MARLQVPRHAVKVCVDAQAERAREPRRQLRLSHLPPVVQVVEHDPPFGPLLPGQLRLGLDVPRRRDVAAQLKLHERHSLRLRIGHVAGIHRRTLRRGDHVSFTHPGEDELDGFVAAVAERRSRRKNVSMNRPRRVGHGRVRLDDVTAHRADIGLPGGVPHVRSVRNRGTERHAHAGVLGNHAQRDPVFSNALVALLRSRVERALVSRRVR